MKRERILIASIILLSIICSQSALISAQTAPGLESLENDSLFGTVQTGTEKAGEFQAAENKSDFLKRQWGEILAKNAMIGPVLRFLDKLSPVTNPLFKYTIGLEPSFTWLFILTLILWIFFITSIFRLMRISIPLSKTTQYIMSLAGVIAISVIGITRNIAEGIINFISTLTTWYMQLILVVFIITGLMVASYFSKYLEKYRKKSAKEQEEEKLKSEVKTIKGKIEVQEELMKAETEEV